MEHLIRKAEFTTSNRGERTVDTQRASFSAEGAGVGALEVLEHAVSIGNEIGGHLNGRQMA